MIMTFGKKPHLHHERRPILDQIDFPEKGHPAESVSLDLSAVGMLQSTSANKRQEDAIDFQGGVDASAARATLLGNVLA